jgi:hypothetical protein
MPHQNKIQYWGFHPYNKEELFEKVNAIEIFKSGDQVITKYFNRVINTVPVSKRYEIFDIKSFLKNKIDQLEANFKIIYYKFVMRRGIQELTLLSDVVEINNTNFYKSFFILNSSDKSRCLNINMGLFREDNNSYIVSSIRNMSLYKRHLTGLTQLAEDASISIDIETFDDQIASIKSLIGERVMLSKVREIIVDKDLKINHRKFDAFKNQLIYSSTDKIIDLSKEQLNTLKTYSESLNLDYRNDFSIDAYKVFNCYMQVFARQDSYVVKKETEKILRITQCFIRNEKLDKLLELM